MEPSGAKLDKKFFVNLITAKRMLPATIVKLCQVYIDDIVRSFEC